MTDYFTADLHLGHKHVAEIRGFTRVEDHDRTIYSNLHATLKPGDRMWILGDISGGYNESQALQTLEVLATETQSELHLIAGNHDSIHPMHRHSEKTHTEYRSTFTSTDTIGTIRHRKDKIMLSHFPYQGDRGADRYPEYRLPDHRKPLIHGHTHSTQRTSQSRAGSLQICVSLDAWDLKPASRETLTKIIDQEDMNG